MRFTEVSRVGEVKRERGVAAVRLCFVDGPCFGYQAALERLSVRVVVQVLQPVFGVLVHCLC